MLKEAVEDTREQKNARMKMQLTTPKLTQRSNAHEDQINNLTREIAGMKQIIASLIRKAGTR